MPQLTCPQLSLENAAVQEDDKASDPDLLMDILETREALEEVSSRAEIEPIRERNRGAPMQALRR